MNKITKLLIHTSVGLACLGFIGCSGTAVGLNEFKPVTTTELFSQLDAANYSAVDNGGLVEQLIVRYQRYGALSDAVEKESPTVDLSCYDMGDKIKAVQPMLQEQTVLLGNIQTLYNELETLKKDDPAVGNAVEAGTAYVSKASQRVQKHIELMDIMTRLTGDCPGPLIILFPAFYGLPKYFSARGKAPEFNKTASELEELSAEEKKLAANVLASLKALRSGTSE